MTRRIGSLIRDDDTVARFGGDEFLVVLKGVRHLQDAHEVAEKIRQAVGRPVGVPGGEVRPALSLGVTLLQAGEPVDRMIARADKAMYEAKHSGRNTIVLIA